MPTGMFNQNYVRTELIIMHHGKFTFHRSRYSEQITAAGILAIITFNGKSQPNDVRSSRS